MHNQQKQKGFTLVELMTVISIIGILAAIVTPMYRDYIGRAQFSEAMMVMAPYKNEVVMSVSQVGNCGTYPSTQTRYIDKVIVSSGKNECLIEATFVINDIHPKLSGQKVTMVGNTTRGGPTGGKIEWSCRTTAPNAVTDKQCLTVQ